MKKLILVILLLVCFSACKQKEIKEEDSNYSLYGIIAPSGAPSLAFLNEIDNVNFETNAVPQNIVAMMNDSSEKRVVVIDTISGIKAINNGAPYKMAANITFGNFYIAATGNDANGVLEPGDRIVLFGQGITPDIIFHYVYGNIYDETIEYVGSVSDAGKCLAAGKNFETGNTVDYVLIAEPALTNVMYNKEVPTYGKVTVSKNIQKDYKEKTGLDMIQASLFIKNDDYVNVDNYLAYLETNINDILTKRDYVSSLIDNKNDEEISSKYGVNKTLLKEVLVSNTIGLGYKKAYDNKEAIDNYIALFNLDRTNEEIYYK